MRIVQHHSMFDYVALTGTTQGRMMEWIDHLHEHFVTPAVVTAGRYLAPEAAGASTRIRPRPSTGSGPKERSGRSASA